MENRIVDIENKTKECWKKFVNMGEINETVLRPIIVESWKECKKFNVNPYDDNRRVLSQEKLEQTLSENRNLIHTAKPFIMELYKIVEGSGFVAVLTDKDANILHIIGDKEIMDNAEKIVLKVGANWGYPLGGNTAIGLSLLKGLPFQVVAYEHYSKAFHPWTCSAAPIRNPDNAIIGTISISGNSKNTHRHTLGMVVGCVKAIENSLRLEMTSNQLLATNKHMATIIESISNGIITIDCYGKITLINKIAKKILGLNNESDEDEYVPKECLKPMMKSIHEKVAIVDEEIDIINSHGRFSFIITAKSILNHKEEIVGAVALLRGIKSVKKLVNRMAGATATFTFNSLIGTAKKFIDQIGLAKIAAQSSSNILIIGESGVGKELFAQAIHNASSRKDGMPFVAINCAAIPRELIASELFGYSKGAFTGARSAGKPGKFEMADGGTLFLDEIGDMPLDLQANLLRVLETRQITRLGDNKIISINVRIIAATHKNLKKEIAKNNFRQDLFFRLKVFQLDLPPLRERREDIPSLAEHFIKAINHHLEKKIIGISQDVLETFKNYFWPGNVRELHNVIERSAQIAENGVIQLQHLPNEFRSQSRHFGVNNNEGLNLRANEILLIKKALDKFNGEITISAKKLGISRNTLYRKIERYDIV